VRYLEGIYEFIARRSELYARKLADKLVSRADELGDFPLLGRMVLRYNDPTIRELVVSPYTIVYLVQPEHIEILTVIHSSRDRND
jgi:toxin ParE1/3/4